MKNHKKKPTSTSFVRRFPRLLGTGIALGMVLLTVGVVAGISKQSFGPKESRNAPASMPASNDAATAKQKVQVGAQTSQIKPLTQEEAQRLAVALKELANQSTDGLEQVQHADGSVSMDLQGRFQNVVIAKRNDDGSVSQSCIDNPAAGAAFFGLDPKLVGVNTKPGSASAPNTSPANR